MNKPRRPASKAVRPLLVTGMLCLLIPLLGLAFSGGTANAGPERSVAADTIR